MKQWYALYAYILTHGYCIISEIANVIAVICLSSPALKIIIENKQIKHKNCRYQHQRKLGNISHHSTPVYMHADFCNMPGALGVRAVCTPSMRSDNSLHATSTPWALRDYAVNRQSELRGSAVARRAVGAPRKRHCRRGRAVTSPRYGKC